MALISVKHNEPHVDRTTISVHCQRCRAKGQEEVIQWKNDLEIQHFKVPSWRCNNCRHTNTDEEYRKSIEAALVHPNKTWKDLATKKQELVRRLSTERADEISSHLEDLWKTMLYRWAEAVGTVDKARQSIQASIDETKTEIFNKFFRQLRSELIALQRFTIDHLLEITEQNQISSSERLNWPSEAMKVVWRPLEPSFLRWIIGTLDLWHPAASEWIAPTWLWGTLDPNARILWEKKGGGWWATQKLIRAMCDAAHGEVLYAREKALADIRLKLRRFVPSRSGSAEKTYTTEAKRLLPRRTGPPPNKLKLKIAELKCSLSFAKQICNALDKLVERGQSAYETLPSWQKKAPGKRTWVQLYEDGRTKNDVRTYINKVKRAL
jgi:hypothetical protein